MIQCRLFGIDCKLALHNSFRCFIMHYNQCFNIFAHDLVLRFALFFRSKGIRSHDSQLLMHSCTYMQMKNALLSGHARPIVSLRACSFQVSN